VFPIPGLATLEGVELASVGTHDCMTGTWDCTAQDITDAVAASQEPEWRAPIIKLGHTDPRFDGEPAVGTIRNLRTSPDGRTLIGDLTGLPQWLADSMPSAYPSRSVEGVKKDIAASGRAYSFRLSALALLGVEPPAIESLADIARLYDVAAANSQQATGYGSPIVTVGPMTPVTAPVSASAAPSIQEGPSMDPVKFREALGLPADASNEAVSAKLAVAGFIPKISDPAPVVDPVIEPKLVVDPPKVVAPVVPEAGTAELEATVASLMAKIESFETAQANGERDSFLDAQVAAGRLKPADRPHYEDIWEVKPERVKLIMASRGVGSEIPVSPAGHAASPEGKGDHIDQLLDAAFPDPDAGKA
jgi:hypothetical protein